jgi:hypothetical protein
MSYPVVTSELQAGQVEDPKHLPSWDIWVRPLSGIKGAFDHGKSQQDMCPLPRKVGFHKCCRANRTIADCPYVSVIDPFGLSPQRESHSVVQNSLEM